jgi:hypothetical protein
LRFKSAVVLLLIVVIGTTTFPVTMIGQEEPLPPIQIKRSVDPSLPTVVLPNEPAITLPVPTLEGAARANDFVTFDSLYREAVRRGEPSAAPYATLHELWTYGITDPVGAFYDRAIYERLAGAYPSFTAYIAEFRIIDSNGNTFYPTSETRAFLLARALEGAAPRVQLVEGRRNPLRVDLDAAAPRATRRSAGTTRSTTARTTTRRSGAPASSPAGSAASRRRATPAVSTKTEPKAAARDAAAPAGGDAGAPVVSTQAPAQAQAPVAPVATTTEPPVVVRPEPAPAPAQPIAVDNSFGGRGVLLLVIGLIGVGLLAMMLRTPKEVPTSILPPNNAVPPPTGDKPSGPTPVEPLRRPSGVVPSPPQPPNEKNRASGSHG